MQPDRANWLPLATLGIPCAPVTSPNLLAPEPLEQNPNTNPSAIHTRTLVSGASTNLAASDAARATPPDLSSATGLRLDQLLLISTVLLVLVIVGLLGVSSALSTQAQFGEIAQTFTARYQDQTRELGATVSHTLSLAAAKALRDNNYAFLTETVRAISANNPNVLRVFVLSPEGRVVADSDPAVELGSLEKRPIERRWVTATYNLRPVFEYQEPVDFESQQGNGLIVLAYSLEKLQAQLFELEETKRSTIKASTLRTAAFGLAFVLIAAVVAAYQSRRVTRPLGELTGSALQLGEGELDARVDTANISGREVQTLGLVFNHMADRIKWLLEDVKAKAVLEREMQLARTVQETLLPTREVVQLGNLRIAGLCMPADACGGDWWLRAPLGDHKVVLGLGDVTGHGLSTALVAASATSGLAAAIKMRDPGSLDAGMLMTSLNQTLHLVGRGEYQMSAAIALFDLSTDEVEYSSGAHPSPCLFNRHDGKLSALSIRGALLGAAETTRYGAVRARLNPGDVLVWYTDGLTECRDATNKIYGLKRLVSVVQRYGHLPSERLREAIVSDVRQFTGNTPQDDDITVIVAEYGSAA